MRPARRSAASTVSRASRAFRTCETVGFGLAGACALAGVVFGGLGASAGAFGLFKGLQG